MASDIFKIARENYKSNFNIEPMGDICDIDPATIQKYDILCAGFPCQPFSQAGQRRGFDDIRGSMFGQVMRFVTTNQPRIVILENVQGLLSHDKGNTFKTIIQNLENENYIIKYKILKCSDYGIPQMRKRIFIVGFKNIEVNNIDEFFDLTEYENKTNLSQLFNKNFEKETAYTIRCGGKNSPIRDKHNWDGYMVDGEEYRLTIEDGMELQGFDKYNLQGTKTEKWKLLGNTIPTNFTDIIGKQIIKHCKI